MKKKFESAEVRVIKFEAVDIMTASPEEEERVLAELNKTASPKIITTSDGKVQNTGKFPTQILAELGTNVNWGHLQHLVTGCTQ